MELAPGLSPELPFNMIRLCLQVSLNMCFSLLPHNPLKRSGLWGNNPPYLNSLQEDCSNVPVLAFVSAIKPINGQKTKQTKASSAWGLWSVLPKIKAHGMKQFLVCAGEFSDGPDYHSMALIEFPFSRKRENLKLSEIKKFIFRNLCLFGQTLL